jgi:hypothetical protein
MCLTTSRCQSNSWESSSGLPGLLILPPGSLSLLPAAVLLVLVLVLLLLLLWPLLR